MDAKQKLKAIEQQKRRLQNRIQQINNTKMEENSQDQAQLLHLLQRKKMLQEQKRQQQKYKEMENQYNDRKKQIQREKQLERVKNEKKVIELEAAMKRVVFEGIKQKVKGMNSDQLMMRSFLQSEDESFGTNKNPPSSLPSNFKQTFQDYLLKQGPDSLKPKYDLNDLNEKRFEFFERKEELVMRQILLKQFAASEEPIQVDVMNLKRDQLVEQLAKRDINLDEFMHSVKKEDIIQHFDSIKTQIEQNIKIKRQQFDQKQAELKQQEKIRKILKQQVSLMPFKDVQVVKRLIYDILDSICTDYDKRHANLSQQDKIQRSTKLQEEYEQLLNKNLVQQLSNQIVDDMLQNIRKQMIKQSAQEIQKLNQFAHQKTEDCFKLFFGEGNINDKIDELDRYKLNLNFVNEDENQINRPKEQKYLKNNDNNENNVYQTQKSTTNLVNDIFLLDIQEKYFDKVQSILKNQIEFNSDETVFIYDKQLYAVNQQKIQTVHNSKIYYNYSSIDGIVNVSKMHRCWLLQSQRSLVMLTPWNRQEFGSGMGSRISNPCGNIIFITFYPVTTLLTSPTSVLLGFEKGQILKYNYNINRITSRQTNITHYLPVIQHAKSGDQPAFPLDNRNYINLEQQKPKGTDELHQYREFFQHHSEPIVFIGFYRIDKMISIDRSLKCALWQYNKSRGVPSFEPLFKFEIKSSYQIYKQDENPRYKDIYPTNNSTQSPQQMYQKYMLTETFLKMQLYNNPKKQMAYFRAPSWDKEDNDKPIWKITYKQSKNQVNKILQSFYNVIDGKIIAQQVKLQGETIYILCERQHVIRNDLKTIKIYSWNIQEKRLGRIGIEIDMYKDQKINNFVILCNMFKGVDLDLAVVVNSGRILVFSLVSGQLLKNINDELDAQDSKFYFKGVVNAPNRQLVYAITARSILELNWQDGNTSSQRNKINKAIDSAKRKYFR